MNARKRRQFARRLEEERTSLTRAVREIERESELDIIEAAPERMQLRDAPTDAEVAEAATSMELARLREVDAALIRLREHPEDFGYCVVCDEPIAETRLEIVPWAQRCATHASERAHDMRAEIQALSNARD